MTINSNKQIKLGAIFSYLAIALNILAGLLYTPWMVQQIGQSQYGLYTLANSLIALFMVDFGLSSAVSRYLSKYRAENNEEKIQSFLGAVYKLYLIIDAIIFAVLIVVFFCIDSIYVKLSPAEIEQFKVVYIISALFAVLNFPFVTLNGILNSYEKFVQQKLADIIYRVLVIPLTVIALVLGGGLYELVALHAVAGLVTTLIKFICVKRYTSARVSLKGIDNRIYKEIFSFSVWVTVSSLAQRLVFNITPSILGIVSSAAAIAVFGIITTIEGYTYTISGAINGMFLPKISQIYAKTNSTKDLTPLLLKVGKFQFALNGLIVVGFVTVGKLFIELWMGNEYIDAYYGIILVIIPGMFANALQIANTSFVALNKVRLQAQINVIMGIINVVLSFVLSYYLGVIGASLSIFVAYSFRAAAIAVVSYRELGIDIPTFVKQCYLRMSLPVVMSVVIGLLLNMISIGGGWIEFLIKGLAISVCYIVIMYFVGFNSKERAALIKIVLKKFK